MQCETFLNITGDTKHLERMAKQLNNSYDTGVANSFYHCMSIIQEIRDLAYSDWLKNGCVFDETDTIEDVIYSYVLESVAKRLETSSIKNKAFYTFNIDIANNLILIVKGG